MEAIFLCLASALSQIRLLKDYRHNCLRGVRSEAAVQHNAESDPAVKLQHLMLTSTKCVLKYIYM